MQQFTAHSRGGFRDSGISGSETSRLATDFEVAAVIQRLPDYEADSDLSIVAFKSNYNPWPTAFHAAGKTYTRDSGLYGTE